MYCAIIASVATIGAVLYMQGPIIALAFTALGSLSLLIALRYSDRKKASSGKQTPVKLEVVEKSGNPDLRFPPLRERAS